MNIKNLQPNKYRTRKKPFKQGYYNPLYPQKYKGTLPIIYRSSWEYKVCKFLDESNYVIKWGSECLKIPYYSIIDDKQHEYFPDFYFEYKSGDIVKKYVVEVKPKKDITMPIKPNSNNKKDVDAYNKAAKIYIKNMEKVRACKKYCELNNMIFKFVTEDSKLNF